MRENRIQMLNWVVVRCLELVTRMPVQKSLHHLPPSSGSSGSAPFVGISVVVDIQ